MKMIFSKKKALSPLMATLLLVVFAIVVGAITMSWGKSYVEKIEAKEPVEKLESAIVISIKDIDTPLKELQIKYITDQISEEEYLQQEKELIKKE